LSDSLVDVTEAIETYINGLKEELGILRVFYGDDTLIPETPAISIIPESKDRTLSDTGHMSTITLKVGIVIYHSKLDSPSVTRKQCDELAELVEAKLHLDKKLGGVIYGYVKSMEPGVATRRSVMLRATRLQWVGIAKERI
jgi:hypothetical protein